MTERMLGRGVGVPCRSTKGNALREDGGRSAVTRLRMEVSGSALEGAAGSLFKGSAAEVDGAGADAGVTERRAAFSGDDLVFG